MAANRYQTMLKSLHSLVFKQADCKVVTMRRFIESDVKMLSEEGPVRVFIYTNSADKALGISKVSCAPRKFDLGRP